MLNTVWATDASENRRMKRELSSSFISNPDLVYESVKLQTLWKISSTEFANKKIVVFVFLMTIYLYSYI